MKVRSLKFRRVVTPWIKMRKGSRAGYAPRALVMGPRAYAMSRSVIA
jgi:hypothetical protein